MTACTNMPLTPEPKTGMPGGRVPEDTSVHCTQSTSWTKEPATDTHHQSRLPSSFGNTVCTVVQYCIIISDRAGRYEYVSYRLVVLVDLRERMYLVDS